MAREVKSKRRRGYSRISRQHQITLPTDAIRAAGLDVGDQLRVEVRGPGELVLTRAEDPLARYSGALTGTYGDRYLDDLRREWE